MTYRPRAVVRAPIATVSGYGEMARDIVRHLIEYDKYDVECHSINWGETPMNALDETNPQDKMILDRIVPEKLDSKPDLYISISVPTEFQPHGRYNIGITAGIETTQASPEWVQAMNRMDVNFVISEHAKRVFEVSKYQANDPAGNQVGLLQCEKPIEVLHNCVDTYVYKKLTETELEPSIKNELDIIPDKFNFLFVGHWLKGDLGQDRKNVGLLIKIFLEIFKRVEFTEKPGMILKTSNASYSLLDREQIKNKIDMIKKSVPLEDGEVLPNIYLLHGELSEAEMSSMYNHPKVKCNITLTKGEGFCRPLLEASLAGKPIIASGWSGHLDFLNPQETLLLGGNLEDVHESSIWDTVIIRGSKWFSVDHNMAATAMVEVFRNYKVWKTKANKLAKQNKDNFNYKKIKNDTWRLLDKYVPEFQPQPKRKELNIPKLKRVNSPSTQVDAQGGGGAGSSQPEISNVQVPKLKKVETS